METHSSNQTLIIPVDPEHGALRATLLLTFLALLVICFAVFNALIPSVGLNILALIAGFAAAAALSYFVIEPFLKRRWPSGRTVEFDQEAIRIVRHQTIQRSINTREPFSILLWNFKIRQRRNRVPAGWFVVACALEQDDSYLPVYTLASPEQTQSLASLARFVTLIAAKPGRKGEVRQESLRVAGEQRRLRLAESHRWAEGAEMTPQDFQRFITQLQEQFPQWMPLNR